MKTLLYILAIVFCALAAYGQAPVVRNMATTNHVINTTQFAQGADMMSIGPGVLVTNLVGTAGIIDTNYATGSYTALLSGWWLGSNAVTRSWVAMTNGSISFSNGANSAVAVITNGAIGLGTGNVAVAGSVLTTNGYYYMPVTTASLPTPPVAFAQYFASDVMTPTGSGAWVEYGGGNWRTSRNAIKATTDTKQYILNCTAIGLSLNTSISDIYFMANQNPINGTISYFSGIGMRFSSFAGTAAGVSLFEANQQGTVVGFNTGSTTTGSARGTGFNQGPMQAGDFYACGGAYSISNIVSSTQTAWTTVGMDDGNGGVYPVNGCYFLYDRQNVQNHGIAAVNNWICATGKASSYTYIDSGLPVATSITTPNRLAVIATTAGVFFYTNGVQCATTASTIPIVSMYMNRSLIVKTNGTTAIFLMESAPWAHIRHAARTY